MASWFDAIKHNFFQRKQRQQVRALGNLRRQLLPAGAAKEIGLLYKADAPSERVLVWDFARQLVAKGKKVSLLGYVDAAELPAELQAQAAERLANMESILFSRKDLDWTKSPQSATVKHFGATAFDWLLCLYVGGQAQLDFVAAGSAAQARIGHYEGDELPNLEVAIPTEEGNLAALLRNIQNCLGIQ